MAVVLYSGVLVIILGYADSKNEVNLIWNVIKLFFFCINAYL